jgi:hypothetical protein
MQHDFVDCSEVMLHDLQPNEFMDQVAAVGEVLDFKEMPEDRRVSLIATKLIDKIWLRSKKPVDLQASP